MVGKLAVELVTDATAQMDVHHRREEHVEHDELRREPVDGGKLSEHDGAILADRAPYRPADFHRRCTQYLCSGWRRISRSSAALNARVVSRIASFVFSCSTSVTGSSKRRTCRPSGSRHPAAGRTGAPVASASK